MEIAEVGALVKNNYDIEVISVVKIKNVYKLETSSGDYCLKVVHYEYGHFLFILEAIKHLINRGFNNIPNIISTNNGRDYIEFGSFYAYLTEWVIARQCNYDNPIELIFAAGTLANLHIKSENFQVTEEMKPRLNWLKWPEVFSTRKNELLDFQNRINKKEIKTEFDYKYLSMINNEIKKAEKAVKDLNSTDYYNVMKIEMEKCGFCHHDFAHHNVLIGKNSEISIIDFDYCILDTHLHDLASLLIRKMKNGKWDIGSAVFILDAYNSIYEIYKRDIPIMAAFIEFPQDFWQVGIQYYWEKQPWGEEFFMNKLNRITADNEERQEFADEFLTLSYGGEFK